MQPSTYSRQDIHLRPARADECAALGDLCLRSKAVWGYDAAFLEACREELSIRPADLDGGLVQVAELGGDVAGLVQLVRDGADIHLEKLFVDPASMKAGIGRRLIDWAVAKAREIGGTRLIIDADPDAAAFYRRIGARDVGTIPSGSIPGRVLPRLELAVIE